MSDSGNRELRSKTDKSSPALLPPGANKNQKHLPIVRDLNNKMDKPLPSPGSSLAGKKDTFNFDITASITKLESQMNTKVEKLISAFSMEVNKILEGFKDEVRAEILKIESSVNEIKTDLSAVKQKTVDLENSTGLMNTALQQRCDFLQKTIYRQEFDIEQFKRQNLQTDAIITGIPRVDGENLTAIFDQLAQLIQFSTDDKPRIFRPPPANFNHANAQSAVRRQKADKIIVKFGSTTLRKRFVLLYARHGPVNLRSIGLSSDLRIYVNDSLTPLTRKLMAMALDKRKKKQLHSVFTIDGILHVRRRENSPAKKIFLESDLMDLCLESDVD